MAEYLVAVDRFLPIQVAIVLIAPPCLQSITIASGPLPSALLDNVDVLSSTDCSTDTRARLCCHLCVPNEALAFAQ